MPAESSIQCGAAVLAATIRDFALLAEQNGKRLQLGLRILRFQNSTVLSDGSSVHSATSKWRQFGASFNRIRFPWLSHPAARTNKTKMDREEGFSY
jgi:hypothetical protein